MKPKPRPSSIVFIDALGFAYIGAQVLVWPEPF
jgi:hypothetical protein